MAGGALAVVVQGTAQPDGPAAHPTAKRLAALTKRSPSVCGRASISAIRASSIDLASRLAFWESRPTEQCLGAVRGLMDDAKRLETVLRQHLAWEPRTDTLPFQRRARLLQALWREEQGLPVGILGGKARGAVIAMPYAQESLAAFLSPTMRAVVRREVLDARRAQGKVFGRPRIFNHLLSSQPLCFNLFGELADDLALATRVLAELSGGRVGRVTAIDFEYSPGRGDPRYTGDKSAFDVFVRYALPSGGQGFVGIEVKYHEGLGDRPADHRARYDEVADLMGVFKPGQRERLKGAPLQQIWRDHLLAGALKAVDGYEAGLSVLLYPAGNTRCAEAVANYQDCLADAAEGADSEPVTIEGGARSDSAFRAQRAEGRTGTHEVPFTVWTLEAVVEVLRRHTTAAWVDAFFERYLDFSRIDRLLAEAGSTD